MPKHESELPTLLARAWRSHEMIAILAELEPQDAAEAYAIQGQLVDAIGDTPGGWKIGSKTADGPIQGAPLPSKGIHRAGAVLERKNFPVLGLELEIAFSFARGFSAADAALSDQEIIDSIASMYVSIELVSSRVEGWPKVPQLIQLADLQNHGALVVSEAIPYRKDFSFLNPVVHFKLGDKTLFQGGGANPTGDPRRMLPWVVRHSVAQGLPLKPGIIVTTGTYVGAHFPLESGVVTGEIEGLPPLQFTLK